MSIEEKIIYPKYKNQYLSNLFIHYWSLKKKLVFLFLFLPVAWIITAYFNIKKSLGLHKLI